jgi:hypothetical protein
MSEIKTAAADSDGVTGVEAGTPLTRLHFFDGKYLSAAALSWSRTVTANWCGCRIWRVAWGMVNRLGISASSGTLSVTPGLAITPTGRAVLLPREAVDLGKLEGELTSQTVPIGT